jgi:hypothetical protein
MEPFTEGGRPGEKQIGRPETNTAGLFLKKAVLHKVNRFPLELENGSPG